jgi:hypothetical protein
MPPQGGSMHMLPQNLLVGYMKYLYLVGWALYVENSSSTS